MLKKQSGFSPVLIILILAIIAATGLVGAKVFNKNKNLVQQQSHPQTSSQNSQSNCTSLPKFQTPVDLTKVSSILYPGQYRGNEYKAHGGFRFDNFKPADIIVKAPIDSQIERASRYIQNGDIQILLEFKASCGITYRLDHILTVAPKLKSLVDGLPQPTSDSHTTVVKPPIKIKVGEVVALAVGSPSTQNTFVDFGVYDSRHKNQASQDPAWSAKHTQNPNDQYGICWFDLLPSSDSALVKSLPSASSESGTTSDYCK
ncbi:MAG TPA: hypothetical protein VLF63_02060 [Patescibacteria group bacterium]|nr:hypothetical protein [Patescibacteria group bacterium]